MSELSPTVYEKVFSQARILDGPQISESLCARCRHGLVFRTRSRAMPTTHCMFVPYPLPADIEGCSRYVSKRSLEIGEMAHIALEIDSRVGIQDGSYR